MEKNKKIVKKQQNNNVNYATSEQEEIKKFLIVILVVLLCVGIIYLLTRAFVTKDLFNNKEENVEEVIPGTVNYDVAIIGQIFNRPYDEYYVAIYDQVNGDFIREMSSLISQYNSKDKHLHLYTVDLSNELNKSYHDSEEFNTEATSLEDLKVGDITLLKIKKGKIVKYLIDYEDMLVELGVEK